MPLQNTEEKSEKLENKEPLVPKSQSINECHQTEEKGKEWPQYLAVMTSLMAIFISGLHLGWPSPSIPKILSGEYTHKMTSEEVSYVTIIGPVGDIFGSILFPSIVNIIGRKKTILLIALPQLIAFWMMYFSNYSKILLYLARFIGGLAEAAGFTILPIYIGEVTEPRVRGLLGSYLTILFLTGILVINLVGSYLTIFSTALVFSFLPIIFFILFSQMPESPYYLLMKNDTKNAEKSLKILRRKKNVSVELEMIASAVKNQMKEKGTIKDLFFVKQNRKACIIIAGIRIIQQFSGISALIFYIQVLFSRIKILPKHISSTILFTLQISSNIASTFVVDKLGRKPLLLFSTAGCFFVLLSQGIFFAYKDFSGVQMSTKFDLVPIIGITLFMIIWSIGLGGVVNLMIGEIFSASIKAKASCFMNILFALTMIVTTKVYQYTSDNFSTCVPFFLYCLCEGFGFFFVYFYVPETKGKTLDEIQTLLKGDKSTKKLLKDIER